GEKGEYRKGTLPVDAFAPNDWGLYQMHGNVWEWCTDRFGEYEADPVRDPRGAKGGSSRVLRGGGWNSNGRYLRSAYRYRNAPDNRYHSTGLRLAGGIDPQASRLTADRRTRGPSDAGTSASGSTATKPAGSK
ncbi:MAG: formylglycine-generating enzyme family protein, partial [Sulfitobacter sp.]|nr:formylglycine-generating enzyme family protein [Sulfitobacter sp.]